MDHPSESALWQKINEARLTAEAMQDLSDFRSGPVNFKISLWDPATNGVRYLRSLIYNLSSMLSDENWERLRKITNRNLGNPYSVRYNGEEVCLDYLQAVYELEFINRNCSLDSMCVLEIGAGYGRTCHAIMGNHGPKKYCILDLPNCLNLSRKFLSHALDAESFKRVSFVDVSEFAAISDSEFDLCLNIDSFAEMEADTVHLYLAYIAEHCGGLYVKNPVGKYLDKSLDGHSEGEEAVADALSLGLLREVIDIHDSLIVAAQAEKFKEVYCPKRWFCTDDAWAMPWSYYWQAFFRPS